MAVTAQDIGTKFPGAVARVRKSTRKFVSTFDEDDRLAVQRAVADGLEYLAAKLREDSIGPEYASAGTKHLMAAAGF